MKLKLKITKTLKRHLRQIAEKSNKERNQFVQDLLESHLKENETVWLDRVADYPSLLDQRQQNLEALKLTLEDAEKEDRLSQLKTFYADNHMYREYNSKHRKLENLIIPLSETTYYALRILGENKGMSLERYVIDLINRQTNSL